MVKGGTSTDAAKLMSSPDSQIEVHSNEGVSPGWKQNLRRIDHHFKSHVAACQRTIVDLDGNDVRPFNKKALTHHEFVKIGLIPIVLRERRVGHYGPCPKAFTEGLFTVDKDDRAIIDRGA